MEFKFFNSSSIPSWYKALLWGVPAAFFIWVFIVAPSANALPEKFSYSAEINSVDNFYDEEIGDFLGGENSLTTFSYEVVGIEDNVLEVENVFDVRTQAGEEIFSVNRTYAIDRFSHKHVSRYGDRDRSGYLFAPSFLSEDSTFTYWHINYDAPAQMEFEARENLFGLETFKYHTSYKGEHIDQTEDLTYLPGVPDERGVVVEPELSIWVEPVSGRLVKYADETIAHYYDQETREKIAPWNKFSNTFTEQSVREQVALAQDEKVDTLLITWYVPLLLIVVFLAIIIFGPTTIAAEVASRLSAVVIVPTAGVALIVSTGLVLVEWAIEGGSIFQLLPGGAGMNPLTALTFFIIGWALVFLALKKLKIVFALTALVICLPVANLLSLLNIIPFDVDLLLFNDAVESARVPSRMSWFTTINFIILGFSGLSLQFTQGLFKKGFSLLPFLTLAGGLLALIAFVFSDFGFLELWVFSGVSLATALLFIVVASVALYIYKFRITRINTWLFAMFLAVAFITLMMYAYIVALGEQKVDALFSAEVTIIEDTISDRITIYANTLSGGVGLFDASDNVSREEWELYVDAVGLQENYPGIQGLGYAAVVDDEEDFIAQVRAEGFPDFTVYPETDASLRTSILYLEPFDERNRRAFGYDMFSEENRRLAMQRARDTGLPKNSRKITLLQETDSNVQAGFLMYVPVYAGGNKSVETLDDRRESVSGFVYAPFRMGDFMGGIKRSFPHDITFRIFDGVEADPEQLLYVQDEEAFEAAGDELSITSRILYIAGQPWLIEYKPLQIFGANARDSTLPAFIGVTGFVLSLLSTLALYALLSSRRRALAYAERITETLRVSKDQLLEAKTQTEALLGGLGESVIAMSVTGDIIFVNQEAEDFFDFSAEEVKGKSVYSHVSLVDEKGKALERNVRPIYRVIKTKKAVVERSMYVKRGKGKLVAVIITASPVLINGKVVGVVEVFRDVSKERAVDKAKSEFVSLASHQLRTPLSSINWYSEMLLDGDGGKLTKKQKEYLDQVYVANQRMISLVNALLNVSRIELGTFSVEPEEIDFNGIVKDVLKEVNASISERDIHLHIGCKKLATMIADPQLLRMVITNLITNAIKYTEKGGKVSVTTEMVSSGDVVESKKIAKESVLFQVSDTGYGIPKEQQSHIFQKLFRADNVQRKDTEGTGLGLYIVKSIVELAHGNIWFSSVEDEGTTFYVVLPIHGMEKKEGAKRIG